MASTGNIVANSGPNHLPDWRKLAQAQLDVPGTRQFIATLTAELKQSPLRDFGPEVLDRLSASGYFATLTFPADLRSYYTPEQTYVNCLGVRNG